MAQRRFVLLDRDGTIIVERNYLSDPEQVELLPNAVAGLKRLREMGLGLAMVSNQSAVGRGQFPMAAVDAVNAKLCALLTEGGVTLDGIFICPHSPDDGCECRKPLSGLAMKAAKELGFSPGAAFVVGDKACDIQLAKNIGASSILVRTGYGAEVERGSEAWPDLVADDLLGAAEMIGAIVSGRGDEALPAPLRPDSGERFRKHMMCSIAAKQRLIDACQDDVLNAAATMASALKARRKVLICGNGGSAADSQHIAGELVSVLSQKFLRPGLAAIALTTDTSILTASANDFGFGGIFERQVQALGQEGDVLLGISTSGNSENVIRAVKLAKMQGMRAVGLLGGGGGQLAGMVDVAISIPSSNVQNIQEAHITIGHILCDLVERALFSKAED